MNRVFTAMVVSIAVLVGVFTTLSTDEPVESSGSTDKPSSSQPVMIFCAASNRAVMEAVKADYEQETGRRLEIQYGPSQTLLSSIEVSRTGDLYLPADDSYLTLARQKGLAREIVPIGVQQAVIAVRRGNPKNIRTLDDICRSDVRLVQANPDSAAVGKVTRQVLQELERWDKVHSATTAFRTTVTEVANDIQVDAADAGIVYDAVLHTYPDLEYVEVPELNNTASDICIGVISDSAQPQQALHFARYISAADRGLKRYAEFGFRTQDGDEWSDTPELTVFAGSMLRPAIEETIKEFEQREGVRVTRVYNGCGILVAQMKAGQHPDAYFACDTEFMKQVPDLFPDSTTVSQNELVIAVQKGNPHHIASLKDLTSSDLRVGIGHEKQCAMGWLTQNTLKEGGLQQEIMPNVTVQTPTGDMLVNQLRAGSLDAAIVYLSNVAGSADYLDAVRIQGLPCSIATQPFAIAQNSRYRQLAGRLFEQICSAGSRDSFMAEGFRWRPEPKPTTAVEQ